MASLAALAIANARVVGGFRNFYSNTIEILISAIEARDMRMAGHPIDGNSGILAFNYFPNTGDMVIDTSDNFFATTTSNSLRLRNVLAHEHGHGLGPCNLHNPTYDFNDRLIPKGAAFWVRLAERWLAQPAA